MIITTTLYPTIHYDVITVFNNIIDIYVVAAEDLSNRNLEVNEMVTRMANVATCSCYNLTG